MIAVGVLAGCARPSPVPRAADDRAVLGAQLAGWHEVRRRAEVGLLTVSLPAIALREPITAVDVPRFVAVPLRTPRFTAVQMAWPAICERRGVLAQDVFDYAMSWCTYARTGGGDLEAVLARLAGSSVPGLREAAISDLAGVLAEDHEGPEALNILGKLGAPEGALEQLAAAYSVLGHAEDEALVRARLPVPVRPPTGCEDLGPALETFVPASLDRVRTVAASRSQCAPMARTILCRAAQVTAVGPKDPTCPPLRDQAEIREGHYLAAYAAWDKDWFAAVDHARAAMPEPGAEQVALAALSAALRLSCEDARLAAVRARARALLDHPGHEPRWTSHLEAMAAVTPNACAQVSRAGRR